MPTLLQVSQRSQIEPPNAGGSTVITQNQTKDTHEKDH